MADGRRGRWMVARAHGRCADCGDDYQRGERIYHVPGECDVCAQCGVEWEQDDDTNETYIDGRVL
jgi:hypothetical protein